MRWLAPEPASVGLLVALLSACSTPPGPVAGPDDMARMGREQLVVNGQPVNVLAYGDRAGRRVIFIHGTPGSADGWADFLLAAPTGFRYLALDRPGFGGSGPDGAEVSLARQAEAVAALLGGDPKPILVGHSLGGPIAAQVAVDNPGRVAALVLVAGSLDPSLEKTHWAQPLGEWPLLRDLLPRPLRNANRELMALKPQLEALSPRLVGIRCPVMIVHGTADPLVPFSNTRFMTARMTQAQLSMVTLRDRDHFLPWNSRADIEAAIAAAARATGPAC